MAIGKRFTHLNNSGSNHKILDAESAYVTGTLQVGPAIPVLGADTNFFVSGIIGGAGGGTPGVGVFGGDLVVSGTIYGLSGVVGGEQYWASEAAGEIFTSASLVNVPSGSVHAQFLSASNGAEVTGSVLFDLTQGPVSFVISGAENGSIPYMDIVHNSFVYGPYSYMTVNPAPGYDGFKLQNWDGGRRITLNPWDGAGGEVQIISGSQHINLAAHGVNPAIYISPSGSAPTGSIVVQDEASNLADLDLVIRALKLNGDPGVSGYALTSNGPGVTPSWAAFPSGNANYWSEEVAGQLFTSASIVHVPSGSVRAQFLSASNGAEVSGSAIFAGAGGVTVGSDTVFFVSGAIDGVFDGNGVAAFGGDLFVSGNMYVGNEGIGAKITVGTSDPNTEITINASDSKEIRILNSSLSPGSDDMRISSGSIIIRQQFGTGGGEKPVLTVEANRIAYTASTPDTLGITSAGDITLDATDSIFVTASNGMYVGANTVFNAGLSGSLQMLADGVTMFLTGANGIQITNLTNGQIAISGSVGATSPEYWFSTGSNEIYTTGSVLIRGGVSNSINLIEFDISGSEFQDKSNTLQMGALIRVKDVVEADSQYDSRSGSLNLYAASVAVSGAGGAINLLAGWGGYVSSSAFGNNNGGDVALSAGAGGTNDDGLGGAGFGGSINLFAGQGGSGWNLGAEGGSIQIGAGSGGGVGNNVIEPFTGGDGGDIDISAGSGDAGYNGGAGGLGGDILLSAGGPGSANGLENKAGDFFILGGGVFIVSRSISGSNLEIGGAPKPPTTTGFRTITFNTSSAGLGADTLFYVSGNIGSKGAADRSISVFGGDLVVSGNLYAEKKLNVAESLTVTGSAVFAGGITGSLHWIDEAGTVPFLVAGPNTTVNFNNGQWEITGSDEAQPEWYYTANVGEIGTSGSAAITGSLSVATAGTGRGLLKFGGLDIGPITGSASTSTDAILNGNILSASAGVWNGTNPAVLRHEFHILGIGVDSGSGVQTFAATYLVMSAVSAGGVQTALSVTEVSRETSGSFAVNWDVNVANNCAVEVTSSINAGSVEWYAQRVKEMSVNSVGSRT